MIRLATEILALGCAASVFAATPVLTVPKARMTPEVDGVLSPGEWDDAALVTGTQLTSDRGFATEQTRFYLKWDVHNLYLAAVCSDSNVAGIDLEKPYNDCIELFLVEPGSADVTQWILYAAGKADAIRVDAEYGAGYVTPNGKAETSTRINAGDWTIECRIPAESFSRAALTTRYPLRFNVYRSFNENGMRRRDGRGPEYGGFVHVSGQLCKPLDFAELNLAEAMPEPVRMLRADDSGCAFAPIAGARVMAVTNGNSTTWMIAKGEDVLFRNRYDRPLDRAAGQKEAHALQRGVKGLAVNVFDSMTSIDPSAAYAPQAEPPGVRLMVAQNEREAVQLQLLAGEGDVKNVTVRVGDFLSGKGERLPASAWTLSRADTVVADPVGYPSTHGAGDYYDPLRPFTSLMVPALKHAVVWVEVRTGQDASPGIYKGDIVVECEGRNVATIPVVVEVRAFALPRKQSFRTAFNLWEREIYRIGFEGKKRSPEEFAKLIEDYLMVLVDHRVAPLVNRNLNLLPPDFRVVMEKHYLSAMKACAEAGASSFYIGPEVAHADYAKIEEKPWKKLWKGLVDECRAAGLMETAYAYPVDEPGNKNRHLVNRMTRWMKEVALDLKILVTGACSKMPASQFENIDIWCPASHWVNWRNKDIAQKEGKEVWWYPCSGPWYPYPNYHLDIEPGAWRIQTWMSWKWKFDGILYWAAAFYNVEDKTLRHNNSYSVNGDGVLVYPDGEELAPVPSIRLKVIADSMEDYEYFVMLDRAASAAESEGRDAGLVAAARRVLMLDGMVESMDRYALKGWQYDAVRREIADLIEKLTR